ncbi:hypothetical protein TNIN_40811 [Trichonephila inaurata madagascariensis]|uniref:Uncharacterized protein n=1 Tax=Trichonephila inaurata madagascariensis TaxID=2747483 RepID=A0A8X6XPL4_9ARAC|nr:hypothetical protein TNIN_40811 [Trichonephila inaurata madagascariensis]
MLPSVCFHQRFPYWSLILGVSLKVFLAAIVFNPSPCLGILRADIHSILLSRLNPLVFPNFSPAESSCEESSEKSIRGRFPPSSIQSDRITRRWPRRRGSKEGPTSRVRSATAGTSRDHTGRNPYPIRSKAGSRKRLRKACDDMDFEYTPHQAI